MAEGCLWMAFAAAMLVALIISIFRPTGGYAYHKKKICELHGVKMSFKDFKKYYALDPETWEVRTHYSNLIEISFDRRVDILKEGFYLKYKSSDIGMNNCFNYYLLLRFIKREDKKTKLNINNKNYIIFLEEIQERINEVKIQSEQEKLKACQMMPGARLDK